jgi:hypothetical protein
VPLLIATRATSARNGRRGNVELRVLQGRDHLLRRASSTFFALLFRRLGNQVGLGQAAQGAHQGASRHIRSAHNPSAHLDYGRPERIPPGVGAGLAALPHLSLDHPPVAQALTGPTNLVATGAGLRPIFGMGVVTLFYQVGSCPRDFNKVQRLRTSVRATAVEFGDGGASSDEYTDLKFDVPHHVCKTEAGGSKKRGSQEGATMDTTTLLIIILVIIVLGGGGWYGRGRWF